jgi:hypothetical protein
MPPLVPGSTMGKDTRVRTIYVGFSEDREHALAVGVIWCSPSCYLLPDVQVVHRGRYSELCRHFHLC